MILDAAIDVAASYSWMMCISQFDVCVYVCLPGELVWVANDLELDHSLACMNEVQKYIPR